MLSIELPWRRKKLTEVWNWPHVYFFNLIGLWAEEASTKKRQFLTYLRVFSIITVSFAQICLFVGFFETSATENIAENLSALYLLEPSTIGLYKIIQITKHRKSLKLVMDLLDELTEEATDLEDIAAIRSKLRTIWLMFSINIGLVIPMLIHIYARPLQVLATTEKRTRILKSWPESPEALTLFTFIYIYDIFCLTVLALGWALFENIFFCISEYTLCQISVLKRHFERLHLSGRPEETIHLKKIVKSHKKIIQICKELKTASDSVLILETILTVLALCSGLYITTYLTEDFAVVMNIFEISVFILVCTYLICWYSNELALQCQELSTSAYMSDWVNGSQEQKKIILTVMTRVKRLITFGGFIELNLRTFINVLKTSFSYYNFLQSVMNTGTRHS